MFNNVMWTIPAFFSIHRYLRTSKSAYLVGIATAVALQFLSGHPELTLYSLMSMGVFLVHQLWSRAHAEAPGRPRIVRFGVIVVALSLGLALSAYQIIPTAELVSKVSGRGAAVKNYTIVAHSFGYAVKASVPFYHVFTLFNPDLFGTILDARGMLKFNYLVERGGIWKILFGWARFYSPAYLLQNVFVGYLGLFLFAMGLLSQDKTARSFHVVLLAQLVYAMSGPFYGTLVGRLPIFSKLWGLDRMVCLYFLSACVVMGYGIDHVRGVVRNVNAHPGEASKIGKVTLAILSISAALYLFPPLVVALFKIGGWSKLHYSFRNPLLYVPFLVTALYAMIFWMLLTRGMRHAKLLFVILLCAPFVEGVCYKMKFQIVADAKELFPETPGIRFLKSQEDQNFRIVPLSARTDVSDIMEPNLNVPHGLQDLRGHSALNPDKQLSYLRSLGGKGGYNRLVVPLAKFDLKKLSIANAKFLLVAPGQSVENPALRLVYEGADMKIYENLNALPRAYIVHRWRVLPHEDCLLTYLSNDDFDPSGEVLLAAPLGRKPAPPGLAGGPPDEVAIVDYSPNDVIIKCRASREGILVLADQGYPGWRALVDGRPQPILTVNYLFRGVVVTPGEHTVRFTYQPSSFRLGVLIAVLGTVALIQLVWYENAINKRRGIPKYRTDNESI
jgi:hypothetical protein